MSFLGISRRRFLGGTCCAAHVFAAQASLADIDEGEFSCATIEPPREPDSSPAPNPTDLTPYGTAFVRDRWARGDGNTPGTGLITLGVWFLDGSSAQQNAVRSTAPRWLSGDLGKVLSFDFNVPRHRAQIRISFAPEGNWSYVGRGNLSINPYQKTMNLQETYAYVILHEFGHALGLQHEHMNPGAPIVWNEDVVIADMAAQGWSESKTRTNIIERFSGNAACVGDPDFNKDSVMLYPIPKRWTKNGVSFGQAKAISDRDRSCLSVIYKV